MKHVIAWFEKETRFVKPENRRFYKVGSIGYLLGLVHIFFIPVFYWLGSAFMVWFNVFFSVPAFVISFFLNRRGWHTAAFTLAFLELTSHQVLSVYFTGWETGFQYYLFCIAGVGFFIHNWNIKIRVALSAFVVLVFAVIYLFFKGEPVVQVDPGVAHWVYFVNALASMIIIVLLIMYYVNHAISFEQKLQSANKEITTKSNQIIQSISYAQRIQAAVHPDDSLLRTHFSDYFIFIRPKDIVSGDFYWFTEKNGNVIFTVADCTGHGVPGAFMSMLGITMLNEIAAQDDLNNAAKVLNNLRKKIKTALEHREEERTKDGMDMSLGIFNRKNKTLKWAGAYNPLYLLRSEDFFEYKADKQPIGKHMREKPFTHHEILLEDNDVLFMFTDGFCDQIGGEKNKKYTQKRFREMLIKNHKLPMVEQYTILNKTLMEWKGNKEQIDDILVMGINI